MFNSIKKCISLSVIFLSGCNEPVNNFKDAFEYDLCAKYYFKIKGDSSRIGWMYEFSSDKSFLAFFTQEKDDDNSNMTWKVTSDFYGTLSPQQKIEHELEWAEDSCYGYVHYFYTKAINIF